MADELRTEANLFQRLLDRFQEESNAVAISKVSVVVALLSLLMAFMALDNAKDAKTIVEVELRYERAHVKELTDEIKVWQIYSAKIHADLKAHGFEPPPLPEEE